MSYIPITPAPIAPGAPGYPLVAIWDTDEGSDGPPGPSGPQGPPGPGAGGGSAGQGSVAITGVQGEPGEDGSSGPPGAQGLQGAPGARGSDGEAGEPGDPGAVGPRGPAGAQGPSGPPGEDGADANGPLGISAATMLIAPANPNSLQLLFSEDWLGGSSEIGNHCWNRETVGTAGIYVYAQQQTSSTQLTKDHPGIIQILAGLFGETPVGDEACIVAQDVDALLVGEGYRFEAIVYFQAVESSPGSNSYGVFRIGLGDSLTYANHNDGVFFEVDPSQSSGNWRLCCISNGTKTVTAASTMKPAAATWYHLLCEIAPDASLAAFWAWIPGSGAAPTLLGTVTTNIPTGAGRSCGPNLQNCAVRVSAAPFTGNNGMDHDKFLLYCGRPVR